MTTKKTALPVDVEQGKTYLWCTCGASETMPLCDFTHSVNGSKRLPFKFVAEKTATVFLCVCTNTQNPPYCDGFHCDD
jgi:CDGSH-type Zn-finger protein